MSFFNPKIPIKQKPSSIHPWEHRIKAKFFDRYKYTHNSVENPLYPVPKTKHVLDNKPVKFIVIGNRVTREFIYCYHMVRGLYRHRKKEFEAPIIRGVTSVEWPKVWHDLKIQFGDPAYCIESQVAVLINNQFLGGENDFRQLIESKYMYYYPDCLDYYKEGIEQFSNYIKSSGRPCVYLHISINDVPIGPLVFLLYDDIVPLTCQNFLSLCEIKKNGYAGSPIHRIVQDSWIQCGGYTLKNPTELDCENFIVPHDRRGVLGMANAGRNKDCSTQFYILLQPAPWMTHKYVAFGQLIEGERTLKKIEDVPTWYESPTAKITIYKAGVFNMECRWRPINKTATEYIAGHVEDLFQIGKIYYENLLEKVFAVIEEKIYEEIGEEAEEEQEVVIVNKHSNIRSTKSFKRNREDIEKELLQKSSRYITPASSEVNNDFDVEEYEKNNVEEEILAEQSVISKEGTETPKSSKVFEQPYYLPLTDVPYPGEVQSIFNLQRLLRGDYCLETDLVIDHDERKTKFNEHRESMTIPDDLLDALFECVEPEEEAEGSLDSGEETEIRDYIKGNVDTTSFAGPIIKKVANLQDKYEKLQDAGERKKINIYTDEDLRILRVATKKLKDYQRKRVSINKNTPAVSHTKIHRRQTGFIRQEQIEQLEEFLGELREKSEIEDKESEAMRQVGVEIVRTGRHIHPLQVGHEQTSDTQGTRKSVLLRLYNEISNDEMKPTLKNLSEKSESQETNRYPYLTRSVLHTTMKESVEKFFIPRNAVSRGQVEETLELQHGHKLFRKVSSDYANTLQHFDEGTKSSIRCVEYAKHRPSISVVEYKLRNQKYQDELKASKEQMEAIDH